MPKLALLGGTPVRAAPFMSRPHVDELERSYVADCLDNSFFSRFVGSPVGDFRRYLAMPSAEAAQLPDFWSVLGGKYVRLFEREFAAKLGARFAVSMNSATSCLTAGLIALGLKPGDEVVTTPFSFTATATGLKLAGVTVRFADVDPGTYCITPGSVERVRTERTKAVVPVHIMGSAGHVLELEAYCREHGLALLEDSAQALLARRGGRTLGTIGSIGVFSFQESKPIMTGEGGMAITDDADLAYKLRLIRNHGEAMVFAEDAADVVAAAQGYNFRLPEPLAALGYAQAQKLEMLNGIRAGNAAILREALPRHPGIIAQTVTNDPGSFAPYCCSFTLEPAAGLDRERFTAALRAEGVPVATGFPRLMNENLLFAGSPDKTPVADVLNRERNFGFFQVGHPNTAEDMAQIVDAVDKIMAQKDELAAWTPDAGRGFALGR
jgi:dTDP-4-amino-4,6-dideoxygalactose transaminase